MVIRAIRVRVRARVSIRVNPNPNPKPSPNPNSPNSPNNFSWGRTNRKEPKEVIKPNENFVFISHSRNLILAKSF